ncbi:hypothetical protein AXF42_Ash014099 [Apostasia shenzhenica]|uniref:Pectin acetylesterase n=1 Tax=Apostasia shenzhenica TaxID=1088818 RepID=A0A2I0A9E1_9ASPA|nr:hypothetical protein AXF42_Ash014099 [Apostasia shenzhenica]
MKRSRSGAMWTAVIVGLSLWSSVESFRQQAESTNEEKGLLVDMTLVHHPSSMEAVCLDGSPPAYHLHWGFGDGGRNWLLQFEGGGWCSDVSSCLERSRTRRGSTRYMSRLEVFAGILSNEASMNPDFYNWNRVKLRYCDEASFAGDSNYNGTEILHFRGKRIWEAIINDLLPKGLIHAEKVRLATFLHCDALSQILPKTTIVKCMSDAGFFLDVKDVSGNDTISSFFENVVSLQKVEKNLNKACMVSHVLPYQCFFPQYNVPYIKIPFFILNSAYDVYQFHHIFVPPSSDPQGFWNLCKADTTACTSSQISILQSFRLEMLSALETLEGSGAEGMFIDSCFTHCQSELQDMWYSEDSPRINNMSIAEAVGDWYFGRRITKEIDCPYPYHETCQNFTPSVEPGMILLYVLKV